MMTVACKKGKEEMEDHIEIADTIFPKGVVMTAGDKQGHVALHIQNGDQQQNALSERWTNVALPHDQMLLAVVAPWFASLNDEEQRKVLSTLYARRENRFPRQPRPVEMDHEPNDFDLEYLREKGWMWQPKTQGETPCTALLYHDGLAVRTEQAVVVIPKQATLEFAQWVASATEWLDPQGASYQADPRTAFAEYSDSTAGDFSVKLPLFTTVAPDILDGERFFQASKCLIPSFNAKFHSSVQNRSAFQLIYHLSPKRSLENALSTIN
jgi:hypothetical protein